MADTLRIFSCEGRHGGVGDEEGPPRGWDAVLSANEDEDWLSRCVVADFLERRSDTYPSGRALRDLMRWMALAWVV